MKYYSEEELKKIIPIHYWRQILAQTTPINVRFCRDCPCFNQDVIQWTPGVITGWCSRTSYYETLDNEVPWYVCVNSTDFCNEEIQIDE